MRSDAPASRTAASKAPEERPFSVRLPYELWDRIIYEVIRVKYPLPPAFFEIKKHEDLAGVKGMPRLNVFTNKELAKLLSLVWGMGEPHYSRRGATRRSTWALPRAVSQPNAPANERRASPYIRLARDVEHGDARLREMIRAKLPPPGRQTSDHALLEACKAGNLAVLERWADPEKAPGFVFDVYGRGIDAAAANGHVHVLEFLLQQAAKSYQSELVGMGYAGRFRRFLAYDRFMAIKSGQRKGPFQAPPHQVFLTPLELIGDTSEIYPPVVASHRFPLTDQFMTQAARAGHVEVLEWLYKAHYERKLLRDFPHYFKAVEVAILKGKEAVLRWFWDKASNESLPKEMRLPWEGPEILDMIPAPSSTQPSTGEGSLPLFNDRRTVSMRLTSEGKSHLVHGDAALGCVRIREWYGSEVHDKAHELYPKRRADLALIRRWQANHRAPKKD